ncbi:MAG TPA: zf-HC2 domain-containing protein [Microlunatus sp.]|nr:zf-HC2 domain-containing protein [Microlunatus sp.]
MADHISAEELAREAEGLLDPARTDAVEEHLRGCAACRERVTLLASVRTTLATTPQPPMPPEVAARLDAVLLQEQAGRSIDPGGPGSVPSGPRGRELWTARPRFAAPPLPKHRRRTVGRVLLAAALAVLVGFGGYVLSARAGLNEPPTGAAAVSSEQLTSQAGALERSGDLEPHRFSRAWSCARRVTDDRITGIASVTVDQEPALLVYGDSPAGPVVAVVEGCDQGDPRVTATTPLPR